VEPTALLLPGAGARTARTTPRRGALPSPGDLPRSVVRARALLPRPAPAEGEPAGTGDAVVSQRAAVARPVAGGASVRGRRRNHRWGATETDRDAPANAGGRMTRSAIDWKEVRRRVRTSGQALEKALTPDPDRIDAIYRERATQLANRKPDEV